MALFVLGAGATRGCSFVDPKKDPCLPPLDTDFFTQLQRVRNPKHQDLIRGVVQDVVDLFGVNFRVTLETVFTTLENTIRMLRVTGDNRDFKRSELRAKRNRLEQAIAVVFEDSLAEKDEAGHSSLTPRTCEYHQTLVADILQQADDVISFNYDCVIDYALRDHGAGKWHPRYGYGFYLGSKGSKLKGDDFWKPKHAPPAGDSVHLYKLHGSLHFQFDSDDDDKTAVYLKQRPYTKQQGDLRFSIVPPEWHKAYDAGPYTRIWRRAAEAINEAQHIILIGYSLPLTDLHATALFRTSVKNGALRSVVVVNPDQEARGRTRAVLQRGITSKTRVLSVDYLSEFVAVKRDVWER